MPNYDESLSLREARARYFEDNGFGDDGGYGADWVQGKFGPFPFAFPNSDARRRAVPLHDLHHVITGYDTDAVGEGEVSGWEIATGCERHWVAWALNLNAMWLGSLFNWNAVWTAFVRGRHSRNYYARSVDEELLSTELGTARRALLPADESTLRATGADRAAFAGWWCAGLGLVALQLALLLGSVAWIVWRLIA